MRQWRTRQVTRPTNWVWWCCRRRRFIKRIGTKGRKTGPAVGIIILPWMAIGRCQRRRRHLREGSHGVSGLKEGMMTCFRRSLMLIKRMVFVSVVVDGFHDASIVVEGSNNQKEKSTVVVRIVKAFGEDHLDRLLLVGLAW